MIGGLGMFRIVFEDDQERRLRATDGNTQQGAHAELLHAVLIEDVAFQAVGIRHVDGGFHQLARR